MDVLFRWCLLIVFAPRTSLTWETAAPFKGPLLDRPVVGKDALLPATANGDVGAWSAWSDWSPCSTTCGRGVSVQTRSCLSSSPSYRAIRHVRRRLGGGKESCSGAYKRFKVCSIKPCGEAEITGIRRTLCASFNNQTFQGQSHRWVPYFRDAEECELNCRPVGYQFYTTLLKSLDDGTPCSAQPGVDKVCIDGRCTVVGCDGVVGSGKVFDRCGVCGGDNSSCKVVSGLYTRQVLPVGYNLISQLPRGACDINITAQAQSRNYLALRAASGRFILNGDWIINWSGEYEGAGTTFHYRRHDGRVAEAIAARGPLKERVDLLIIYQQPKVHVLYEYILPLYPAAASTEQGDGDSPPIVPYRRPKELVAWKNGPRPGSSAKKFRWKIVGLSRCTKTCGGGVQHTEVVCLKLPSLKAVPYEFCRSLKKPAIRTVPCKNEPCLPSWSTEAWGPCSVTCGRGVQTRVVSCVQEGKVLNASKCPEPQPSESTPCLLPECPRWSLGPWKKCSAECGKGLRKREVVCVRGNVTVVDEKECVDPPPRAEEVCDMGPCKGPTWYVSPWRHGCSSACGSGVQRRTVVCVRPLSQDLAPDKADCDPRRKPPETRQCTSDRQCGGRWFVTPWSSCSVTCGNGTKFREAICMVRTGLGWVPHANCSLATRPSLSKPCSQNPCKSEWLYTEWGQCSKSCRTGVQTREVACIAENGTLATTCPVEQRPSTRQTCNRQDCPRHNQRDTACVDNYLNCRLVAQARLCGYPYYKNMCCQTCSRMGG